MPTILINILLLILVIGILVFVHELGHYIAARMIGVKVFEFALGFGPKVISKRHKGTMYSIRLLPLGGYVKILGDGDPDKKEKVTEKELKEKNLDTRPKLQQIFVMLAGVTMNILLAITFYYIVLANSSWKLYVGIDLSKFTPIGAEVGRERVEDMEYIEVKEDGTAFKAGIPAKGKILTINGQDIQYNDDVSKIVKENKGQDIVMNICENVEEQEECKEYTVTVSDEGMIGIVTVSNYIYTLSYEKYKLTAGFSHLANNLRLIGSVLSSMFKQAKSTGDYSDLSNSVSGPVGLYYVISSFKKEGVISLMSVVADLSISLAIMNVLPIPALDGGRVLILTLEGIFRKDLNKNVEALIINLSFIFLLLVMVAVMVKDIVNIDNLKNMFG